MTDVMSGKEIVQKAGAYVEALTGESRKALIIEFNNKYKGAKFNSISQILSQTVLDWFSRRDKNLKLLHESANDSKLGELRLIFQGETKRVRFKIHVDAMFTLATQSIESACYLKSLNVSVDPREFSLVS